MTTPMDPVRSEDPSGRGRLSFQPTRRQFVQTLGVGLLIAVLDSTVVAQARHGGRGAWDKGAGSAPVAARVHIGKDGTLTVLTGKVEGGQGARAEITQAAAEELRVPPERIVLLMADTQQVPDDGITAGSRTTPHTLPAVRQGCAAARGMLLAAACRQWGVKPDQVQIKDGKARDAAGGRTMSYAELAGKENEALSGTGSPHVTVTPVSEWKTMGADLARPNARDLVTGAHKYPSDITLPDMLHGKVLRPPAYGATLTALDLGPAQAMSGVAVVRDGAFVGVAAPTAFAAQQAIDALEKTAKWQTVEQPSSDELFEYLAKHVMEPRHNPFADDVSKAVKSLKQDYQVAYAQHAPLEPRAACAAWEDGRLAVWTGTQNPFGVRGELARAFGLPEAAVRVIVPDFGGAFGGKHTGECAVEAARLAQGAKKPVSLRWTREEEFTWAYFRPAALMTLEASLDGAGTITSWHQTNINAGPPGINTPYHIAQAQSQAIGSHAPLRQGSYRALAATANNFARECFMDELAALAGQDPLAFRLAHLRDARLRAVLEEAAKRFDWQKSRAAKTAHVGVGLACGTEKGSYVAACAEVAVNGDVVSVRRVSQVFECGAIVNPVNLMAQVQGALTMGLGPALREGMTFAKGKITNGDFAGYRVPRFSDVPALDVHLLNRPDLSSAGAGETPIIVIAPAIGNAVCHATGQRLRSMPLKPAAA